MGGCKTDETSDRRYGSVLVGRSEATAGIQALVELLNFLRKVKTCQVPNRYLMEAPEQSYLATPCDLV